MADHVVDRGADRVPIAAIAQAGGQGPMIQDEVTRQVIDEFGGDPGLDVRSDHVETFRCQSPGLAHALEVRGGVDLDGPVSSGGVEQISHGGWLTHDFRGPA